MVWKLGLWAVVAFGTGELLTAVLSPMEAVYAWAVFLGPFIIVGFQRAYLTDVFIIWAFGLPVFTRTATDHLLTFWGIPIGGRERVRTEWSFEEGLIRLLPVILEVPARLLKGK